jgi:hypothetical protein
MYRLRPASETRIIAAATYGETERVKACGGR